MTLQSNENSNEKIIVCIDEDIEDLVPGFLENRYHDL